MENTPKVVFLIAQDGDWEGIYHKGILHDDYHHLYEGIGGLLKFIHQCEIWGVKSFEITTHELIDEDDEELCRVGSLPTRLDELKGFEKYNKLNIK
jgi:hypothetical protein